MLEHFSTSSYKIRNFYLSHGFLEGYRNQQPDWGPVGYFTYKRTYARPVGEDGEEVEEFWQTCRRVIEGVYTIQKIHCRLLKLPWDDRKAQRSAQEMFTRLWQFKFTPPGRGLWTMGTNIISSKGGACLNNCGFTTTQNIDINFADPFCFLMDMSMLGVGVGGDVRGAGKVKLQSPKVTTIPYVVEDSREGWVELIRTVINSYIGKGHLPTSIDYSQVRKRGESIKGFGGVASGPEPLIQLVENLNNLLDPGEEEKQITSTQIVDIFNYIGKCVVSGGVRRTAEIMFGSPSDSDFLSLKQDKEALMDRRWASNNSIFGFIGMDYTDVAKSIAVNGEPGIIWLDNMRQFSRMGNGPGDNKDMRVMGSNPCSEQSLEDHELCCLVETYPSNHESFEDYRRTLKMAYLYAKTVTLIPTHDQRTNAVMMRNRRIGTSMSGIQQAKVKLGHRTFYQWCENGYEYIQNLDEQYSSWLCIPRSIKTTSVKPSGTVSLLAGATPGIHYPHAEYYIRNIRVQDTSPLKEACIHAGYKVEPDAYSNDTSVISFPIYETNFVKSKKDVSIWEQFAEAAAMQKYWADNQVSVTIHFKPSEVKDIVSCLEMYEDQLKSVSLLPLGDEDGHGYVQAPYIEITKEQYNNMSNAIKPLDLTATKHEVTDLFCDGASCTVQL